MKSLNYSFYFSFFGILFLIVLYKVLNVPITHDEVPTTIFYSKYSYWGIMMFPDNIPNNHILNTLLTKCCIQLFGKEQWSVRLPNLLSFILFAIGAFRIIRSNISIESFYFPLAAILFVNPYLLDFFGLSRGYGLSSALLTLSVSFLITGYKLTNTKHIWYSLFLSILASYANFTLLVFWIANTSLVILYFLIHKHITTKQLLKNSLIIGIISISYLVLIYVPIKKMQSTNEFQYWTSNGFYKDTIISLIYNWQYDSYVLERIGKNTFSIFNGIVLSINIVHLFWTKNNKLFNSTTFISITLLLLTSCVSIVQSLVLKTPNLCGRTALFIYPLFSVTLISSLKLIPDKTYFLRKILPLFLLLLCMVNLASRISLKSVKEWAFDQDTFRVINYLNEIKEDDFVTLKTSWFFDPSFNFYFETGKIPWIKLQPYDSNIDINTSAEYYYIFSKEYKFLSPRFQVIYKFSQDRWLVKRK